MLSHRHKAYLFLILTAAIWGAAGPVIKYTLEGFSPLPFLTYRFLLSSFFSIAFFAIKIKKGKKFHQLRSNIPLVLIYGLLAVPIALGILFAGLNKTTVLDLTLIGVIGPLIVFAGGALFFHDRITKREKTGIVIVLLGVLLNSFYPLLKSGADVRITGNILLLLFLLADSGAILIAKKIVRKKVKSSNLTSSAFIVGALVFLPVSFYVYGVKGFFELLFQVPFTYHLGVWYMAFLSGNLAYFLYVRGQRSIEVSEAILFNYLQPIFMIPLALFWLKESLTPSFIIGAVIITIGVLIAEIKPRIASNIRD